MFSHENKPFCVPFGGDKRDRTADLLNAIQALSQLSYTPEYFQKWKFPGTLYEVVDCWSLNGGILSITQAPS